VEQSNLSKHSQARCAGAQTRFGKMLDEYSKEFGLENQDWRNQNPWYEPDLH
jgi:hypothetical protein